MRSKYAKYAKSEKSATFYKYPDRSSGIVSVDGALAVTLNEMGYEALLKNYRKLAKDNGDNYGCANCLGIETLKSCLAAQTQLGLAHAELAKLATAHPVNTATSPFGSSPEQNYIAGLQLNGKPHNPLKSTYYATLRQRRAALGQGASFMSVTKQSANAHAVLSRSTLDCGMRYALAEFIAAAKRGAAFRTPRRYIEQSLSLAGWGSPNAHALLQKAAALSTPKALSRLSEQTGPGIREQQHANSLMDQLVTDLHTASEQVSVPWTVRRAKMAGLCTVYRQHVLEVSAQRRALAPDPTSFIADLYALVSANADEQNSFVATYNVNNVRSDLGKAKAGAFGAGDRAIDRFGLTWTTVSEVEFGHQCGSCEDAQGDADLTRRLIDHLINTNGVQTVNPSYGVTYAALGLVADGDTVWDLSNAVVCEAVRIQVHHIIDRIPSSNDSTVNDFLQTLVAHCYQTPSLFIAYCQILFLELALGNVTLGERRLVKVLA